MEFTGERVVPGLVEADLFNEHLARYVFAEAFVPGKRVLDAGCGSGYGAARLASKARLVVGVDNSAEAITYAQQHYGQPKLLFLYGDCQQLPLADGAFDLVVSFEVIEHLPQQERFLEEVKRVLRPAGVFLLSTPNRVYYSEERQQANPFHHREFNRQELASELGRYFPHVRLLAQSHAGSLVLAPLDGSSAGVETVMERGPRAEDEPHYFLGICSSKPLKVKVPSLCYVPEAANILRQREQHIRGLDQEVTGLKEVIANLKKALEELQAEFAERTRWAEQLNTALKEREHTLGALQKEYEDRTAWALQLENDLKERGEALGKLQKEYDERTVWALELDKELKQREQALGKLQAEFDERTVWALQLDAELKKTQERFAKTQEDFRRTQEELRKAQDLIVKIKNSRAYRLAKFLRLV